MAETLNEAGTVIAAKPVAPIRVGVVFAAFPVNDLTPYKYFILLLNQLQHSCEFEIHDVNESDPYLAGLSVKPKWWQRFTPTVINAKNARAGLGEFGARQREEIAKAIQEHDLATEELDQLIIVTGVTLSDAHYLIRRKKTTLLALGLWEKTMAPPSVAEFLQLLVLRAPYSALEGHVWNTIHLGNRGCIFDFTENLENTRFIALSGVGVCSQCAAALEQDGFSNAPAEIRHVAGRAWRGDRSIPGSPANVMERLGYPLFLTKGFERSWAERIQDVCSEEFGKELIKLVFILLIAYIVFLTKWQLKP